MASKTAAFILYQSIYAFFGKAPLQKRWIEWEPINVATNIRSSNEQRLETKSMTLFGISLFNLGPFPLKHKSPFEVRTPFSFIYT